MVGMDIQFFPEIKHDMITSYKVKSGWLEDLSSQGHSIGWESHCLPEIKHDNILQSQKWVTGRSLFTWVGRVIDYLRSNMITSYKVESGDWKIGERMACHKLYPFGYCLKLQLSTRLEIVSVSQTDRWVIGFLECICCKISQDCWLSPLPRIAWVRLFDWPYSLLVPPLPSNGGGPLSS